LPTPATALRGFGRQFLLLSSVAFALGFGAGGLTVVALGVDEPPAPPARPGPRLVTLPIPATAGTAPGAGGGPAAAVVEVAAVANESEARGVAAEGDAEDDPSAPLVAPASSVPAGPSVVAGPPTAVAALPAASAPAETEVEIRRGDTLMDVLTRAGVELGEAHDAVGDLRRVANLRRLQIGTRLALALDGSRDEPRRLARLVLPVDAAREVRLVRAAGGGFAASSVERPLQLETARVAGAIADSVYGAARAAGLPNRTLAEMIKLLSWDVDFQRDIHPGDRFEAVYERRLNEDGAFAAAGDLLFVGLDTRERDVEAYRFAAADGDATYYDRDGRALRKWLLRTPIDGAKLSSKFGPRRHPVLGYTRIHKGIDFAAPTGTPILAAGDGVVDFAGRNKGYGNYVRVRHDGEYSTAYAHLSRFPKGMRRGLRINQGDVIGYVGSSGLSTGPHLHYEVLQRGAQVNPLAVKAATFADRLRGAELSRFLALRDRIDELRRRPDRDELVAQRAG
jgi:murein DD-endopeptidase MepM/ murein hydrolase activator NlpD